MADRTNSDLDKSATMNVEDFTKAFELNSLSKERQSRERGGIYEVR